MGNNELIPWFYLLKCMAFDLLFKLSLSQHLSFLTFTLPINSSIPPQGWGHGERSELLCGAHLLAGVKP